MTPEPSPLLCCEPASTETVDGSTFAATSCTEPAGAAARVSETGALVFNLLSELSAELAAEPEFSWAPNIPPPKPATRARATAVATTTGVRRPLLPDGGSVACAGGLVAVAPPYPDPRYPGAG